MRIEEGFYERGTSMSRTTKQGIEQGFAQREMILQHYIKSVYPRSSVVVLYLYKLVDETTPIQRREWYKELEKANIELEDEDSFFYDYRFIVCSDAEANVLLQRFHAHDAIFMEYYKNGIWMGEST